MARRVVQLPQATPQDSDDALAEVSDFALTDMGFADDGVVWTYRLLREPALTNELKRLSRPENIGRAHGVTFQPCLAHEQRSQDRYVVREWTTPGSRWLFTGIFDGKHPPQRAPLSSPSPTLTCFAPAEAT